MSNQIPKATMTGGVFGAGGMPFSGTLAAGYSLRSYNIGNDLSTDFERMDASWVGNIFNFRIQVGGTGVSRTMGFDANNYVFRLGGGNFLVTQRNVVNGLQILGLFGGQVYTVATLPAAANWQYYRAFVSDALAPAWNNTVAGGGAVKVPVWSDGVNWIVG